MDYQRQIIDSNNQMSGRTPGTYGKDKTSTTISNPSENGIEGDACNEKNGCFSFQVKRFVSGFFELLKVNDLLLRLQNRVVSGGKFIRAINYHCVPPACGIRFEKQLQFYQQHFSDVTEEDLGDFLFLKKWNKKKPGLIITFDDGDLSNYSIAAPLLEKYGFTGWFFIPTGYSCGDPVLQREFAAEHSITFCETGDPRIAMSAAELGDLVKRGHVIGSHTQNHCWLRPNLDNKTLNDEIIGSKKILENTLGKKISSFAWVGGETNAYSSEAAQFISDAGYQFSFMTNSSPVLFRTNRLQIQRTNIEGSWPVKLVKFQLSGVLDLAYFFKREKINRLTSVGSASDSPNPDEGTYAEHNHGGI